MTRAAKLKNRTPSYRRHNATAILVACLGVTALYLNFNPTPAGADPDELTARLDRLTDMMASAGSIEASRDRSANAADDDSGNSDVIRGERALLLGILLLERGVAQTDPTAAYTATVFTRERVGGTLLDPQVMNLKLRQEPLSIYMKWLVGDKGRELLYVEGQNDGNMLVKVGGIKGKLLPPLKLNPSGSIALQEARYPATRIGMLELAREILVNRHADQKRGSGVYCEMLPDQEFDDRACYCFYQEFDNAEVSPLYRKSIVLIDKEWCLPVVIKNYTWPMEGTEIETANLDEETLIEHYSYSDVRFDKRLADADFDRTNKNYNFTR